MLCAAAVIDLGNLLAGDLLLETAKTNDLGGGSGVDQDSPPV
jgi:hypothetical protein